MPTVTPAGDRAELIEFDADVSAAELHAHAAEIRSPCIVGARTLYVIHGGGEATRLSGQVRASTLQAKRTRDQERKRQRECAPSQADDREERRFDRQQQRACEKRKSDSRGAIVNARCQRPTENRKREIRENVNQRMQTAPPFTRCISGASAGQSADP